MAMPQTVTSVTPEEYLARERLAEFKHEYIDGEVVSMSGGSRYHSIIKLNLATTVNVQLADRTCNGYDNDLRVRVDRTLYVYPDLTGVCGESEFADDEFDVLLNPTVVFEVLSPSTEAHDRGTKWTRYRQMPSLQQYVLVSQARPLIEVFTRSGDVWTFSDAQGLDASLHLATIDVTLALANVYGRVTFEPEQETGLIGEPRD